MDPPLESTFFERDTLAVARDLLGCRLWRRWPETGAWLACNIIETEAYTADDPACHAYNRKKGRAEMLYAHPGTAYVYLIYGMYDCLNVVTEPHGTAGAVLFRAVEPPPEMGLRTNGPGRLTRALQITRQEFNGRPMTETDSGLFLSAGQLMPDESVIQTTRIGITKATDYPWRFYIKDNPWVSVK
jgi:DNA-3-methyladenine glycosylase